MPSIINRTLLAGMALGASVVVAIAAAIALMTPRHESVPPFVEIPQARADEVTRLATLRGDVEGARERTVRAGRERDQVRSWAAHLARVTREGLANESAVLYEELGPLLDKYDSDDPHPPPPALKAKISSWEDLPREAIGWLGLDAAAARRVTDLMRRERETLFAKLRALADEPPRLALPRQDDGKVLAAFHQELIAMWVTIPAERRLEFDRPDPSRPDGSGQPLYLEDYVPPSNRALRVMQAIREVRDVTLESARAALTREQHARLAALLGYEARMGGARVGVPSPRVHARRPR